MGVTQRSIVRVWPMDEVPRDEIFSGLQAGKKFHEEGVLLVSPGSGRLEKGLDDASETDKEEKLGELWGLLLWVYFMGVPSTVPRSGKPGWPTDGDEACGPSGGPVAVDHEGRSPAQDQ